MAAWENYLACPFDLAEYPELSSAVCVEGELFAQIFSIYNNPTARASLEKRAPNTAAFMKEVINDIQSTVPLQIQTPQVAAKRTLAFKNRNAQGGAEVGVKTGGGGRRDPNPGQGYASKSAGLKSLAEGTPRTQPRGAVETSAQEAQSDGAFLNLDRLTSEPSTYAEGTQRSPSLSRGLTALRKQLDAGKLSLLGQIKQWLKEFVEKAKALFGLKSDAAVISALNSLVKSDGKFVTGQKMLSEGQGNYESIKGVGGAAESGGQGSFGRLVSRAAKKYSGKYSPNDQDGKATLHAGKKLRPLQRLHNLWHSPKSVDK